MRCENISYSKTEIVQRMQQGGPILREVVETVIKELCQCRVFMKLVLGYVLQNQGNAQDAEDAIQDGLAQLAISLYENKYKGDASLENYAFGICKFIWNNQRRKKSRLQYTDPQKWSRYDRAEEAEPEKQSVENEQMIWTIIEKMSKDCKEILQLVYKGLSYRDIGEDLNFAEQTVKNKVSGCRRKLHNYLKAHPQLKLYFAR